MPRRPPPSDGPAPTRRTTPKKAAVSPKKPSPAAKKSPAASKKPSPTAKEGSGAEKKPSPTEKKASRGSKPAPRDVDLPDTRDRADDDTTTTTDAPDPRRWGFGDVVLGFVVAQLLATLAYALVLSGNRYVLDPGLGRAVGEASGHVLQGQAPAVTPPLPLVLTALLQLPLWAGLLVVPIWAAKTKGFGAVRDFWIRIRWVDVPVGIAVGAGAQLLVVPGLYWLLFKLIGRQDVSAAARQLTDRATTPLGVVMLFLIVGVGAPIAEEVFFRGLTLQSFRKRDLGWTLSILATAFVFAASHFQPLQFPALFVFGVVLGVLVQRTGRLGGAVVAHLTFNLAAAAVLVWNLPWG